MPSSISPNFSTLVFTGPSLSPEEAKKILPEAYYHGPVQCGDLIKAMRLGFIRRMVIIDGYFEQRGAVWHREILFALSRGVQIFGASSMGALRASEMPSYGMIGSGEIFKNYYYNRLPDDDEVALVHAALFDSHITPMVNIRPTLDKAVRENIISDTEAKQWLDILKQTPYYNRSLLNFSKDPKVNDWLEKNYVDQKKEDAENLLKNIKNNILSPQTLPEPMFSNVFFNRIFREMICEPFEQTHEILEWLPESEKFLLDLKQQPYFLTLQRIAKLLHLGLDIALSTENIINPEEAFSFLTKFADKIPEEFPITHEILIKYLQISDTDLNKNININININNKNNSEKNSSENSFCNTALSVLADLILGLYGFMASEKISISAAFAQRYADEFRRDRQLTTPEVTLAWIQEQNLKDIHEFETLIAALAPMHHIVDLHCAHLLCIKTSFSCQNWLLLAHQLITNQINFKNSDKNLNMASIESSPDKASLLEHTAKL